MTFTCLSQHGHAWCACGAGMWCSLGPRRLQGLQGSHNRVRGNGSLRPHCKPREDAAGWEMRSGNSHAPRGGCGKTCPQCRHPSCPARVMTSERASPFILPRAKGQSTPGSHPSEAQG